MYFYFTVVVPFKVGMTSKEIPCLIQIFGLEY
jgi:hypothetical protein